MIPMPPLIQLVAVAIGGSFGCVLRYLVAYMLSAAFGSAFPWGTLAVNLFGSAWVGYVCTLALVSPATITPMMKVLLTTGFAGGLTTFSTFAFETLDLWMRGSHNVAIANVCVTLSFGVLAAFCGVALARWCYC